MDITQLTPEFAATVPLSREPFTRHDQVAEIIDDVTINNERLNIVFNPPLIEFLSHQPEGIVVHSRWPLMGRRILKRIVTEIQSTYKLGEE